MNCKSRNMYQGSAKVHSVKYGWHWLGIVKLIWIFNIKYCNVGYFCISHHEYKRIYPENNEKAWERCVFVLHQRINKIFWSPIIDPFVFVKIGKWKPYYFFVCAIVLGERTTNIFADPKNVLDAHINEDKTLCFVLCML